MKLKSILQIVLALVAIGIAYLIYTAIMAPVRFNTEMNRRKAIVINKMKDIRNVETMYLKINGHYCSTFDSLVDFVENGEVPLIKFIARPGDSTFTNPIKDTVGYVNVKDSLFRGRPDFVAAKLKEIPFSNFEGSSFDNFSLQTATINKGNVPVNVIEVFATNKSFLKGLDMRKNNIDPENGLRFGSMTDPITDGNWE